MHYSCAAGELTQKASWATYRNGRKTYSTHNMCVKFSAFNYLWCILIECALIYLSPIYNARDLSSYYYSLLSYLIYKLLNKKFPIERPSTSSVLISYSNCCIFASNPHREHFAYEPVFVHCSVSSSPSAGIPKALKHLSKWVRTMQTAPSAVMCTSLWLWIHMLSQPFYYFVSP